MSETEGKEKEEKKSLGKVLIDTTPQKSGSCPFHTFVYWLAGVLSVLYAVYLVNPDRFKEVSETLHMGKIHSLFLFIDNYSPFHEIQETDEEFISKMNKMSSEIGSKDAGKVTDEVRSDKLRIFTIDELSKYDGNENSLGLYLALLGVVYDVSGGSQYYGPGGGYSFFAGKDASRAFVTGQFSEEGLIDDVSGLSHGDYTGLEEWQQFYEKDYKRVGLLAGTYYDTEGQVTQQWKLYQGWLEEARQHADQNDVEKQMFPPCNVEWSKAEGTRFWCTKKSGGIARDWTGVPRRLFYPGKQPRCACVRTVGPPSVDPSDRRTNRGDLDNPHLKEYLGCTSKSHECRTREE